MKNCPTRPRFCRRRKMVVNFEQLNMTDWILAPVTFDAGICSGACSFPLGKESNPTNHAVLQSIWARYLRASSSFASADASANRVSQPCCVPHELESLPMLYFQSDDRVVLNHRPDMVVRSCGCKWICCPHPHDHLLLPLHPLWDTISLSLIPQATFLHFKFYALLGWLIGEGERLVMH